MFWNDLDNSEPGIGSDDETTSSTPAKVAASKGRYIRQLRTKAWSTTDLAGILAGSDPMNRIGDRVASYWGRYYQRNLVAALKGVFLDNIANDSSDMVYDASGLSAGNDVIKAETIIEAKQTAGDASEFFQTIIMHSRLYANLQTKNLIDFIPDSQANISMPTYLGYRVVVDDGCPIVSSKYWTFIVANGAVGWGESPVDTPVETFRWPGKGNGAGVEELYTRKQFALQPLGFDWIAGSVASTNFPTDTELALAANWNRVAPERKQCGMALLITNG